MKTLDISTPNRSPYIDHRRETAILASCLIEEHGVTIAKRVLKAQDFDLSKHQLIFQCMVNLANAGTRVDLITLRGELNSQDLLNELGGVAYLVELSRQIKSGVNLEAYVMAQKADAGMYAIQRANFEIERLVKAHTDPIEIVMKYSENAKAIHSGLLDGKSTELHSDELANQMLVYVAPPEISTGFKSLDQDAFGNGYFNWKPNQVNVIMGVPSHCKTTLALNFIHYQAFILGNKCCFFSLEMTAIDLCAKLLAIETGMYFKKVLNRNFVNDEERISYRKAIEKLHDSKLIIIDDAPQTIFDIENKIEQLSVKGYQYFFIDYLQNISLKGIDGGTQTEKQEILMQTITFVTKRTQATTIPLSQVSKPESLKRMKDTTSLVDFGTTLIKGSGQTEQDAHNIIVMNYPKRYLMYNDGEYEALQAQGKPVYNENKLFIKMGKTRDGQSGDLIELYYEPKSGRILDMSKAPIEQAPAGFAKLPQSTRPNEFLQSDIEDDQPF